MIANQVLSVLIGIFSFVVVPVQFVTTFVLGILVAITFGLLLIPISLVWIMFFYGPLLGLSWVWEKVEPVPGLPLLVDMFGVPLALLGSTYVALMPSMGEIKSRAEKLRICWTWPFTLEYMRFERGELDNEYERWTRMQEVLYTLPEAVRP